MLAQPLKRSPMFRSPALFLLAILVSSPSIAFDAEGFTTGMLKAAVISKAERSYKLEEADNDTLVASESGGACLSGNCCEGRLAAVQQGFPAKLKQTPVLVSELKGRCGSPFSARAGPSPTPEGSAA